MIKRKSGFTLIELMAVLAIFSIVLVIVFGVFQQGYKIINKTDNLSDIENQFRNTVMDIENEAKNYSGEDIQINDILTYEIKSYTDITPIILMRQNDKLEENILYFKGKKEGRTKYSLEKIVFSNSDLSSGNFVSKETKSMMQSIDGDVIAEVDDKGSLLTLEFSGVSKNNDNRNYSSVVRLDNDTSISLNFFVEPVEPEIPDEPVKPEEIPKIAELFAGYTFIVLDTNSPNIRPNLLNINVSNVNGKENAKYYVQAVSTEVMKEHINYDISNESNEFKIDKEIQKPPALKEKFIPGEYTITTQSQFNSILGTKDGQLINNIGIAYTEGNECVVLINGNLNINSVEDKFTIALKEQGEGKGQKITIYATGKININVPNGVAEMKNATLISGNQININAKELNIVHATFGEVGKLQQILSENLKVN